MSPKSEVESLSRAVLTTDYTDYTDCSFHDRHLFEQGLFFRTYSKSVLSV
jgi:hypothetical protein